MLYCKRFTSTGGKTTFVNSQSKRKMIVEEHVTLVQEPSSRYLEYVTPCVSKAIGLKDSIMHFLAEKMINIDGLQAIECDGTAVNTGRYAGVNRRIEMVLRRPLLCFLCPLHYNELLLRHLRNMLDGPKDYSGPIGQSFSKCDNLPVAKLKIKLVPLFLSSIQIN